MRTAFLFCFVLAAASPQASAGWLLSSPEASQVRLDRFLSDLDWELRETIGSSESLHISIVDLGGQGGALRAGLRDKGHDPAASVIKLALLAEAFHAEAEGRLSLSQKVEIKACNCVATASFPPVSDPERAIDNIPVRPGSSWTVADLLQVMIQRSDNSATNTLIDLLGGEAITSFAKSLGLAQTRVARKLRGNDSDHPCDPGHGTNAMPPFDAATLLSLIAQGKLVSPQASQKMLRILGGQLDRETIARAVEKRGAAYYGKTGEISTALNDAAIVMGPGRRYVLVIYLHPRPQKPAALMRGIAESVDLYFSTERR